ncbi:MAG TPA: SUMF1/EgtB/PvdO family nonheme iron enzyme [Chitinispirillaceae bacterium]|nr:SUMF1/EgtB/PvdO family nonheme iron enzyme [Chitinispirillaceae bacterium]
MFREIIISSVFLYTSFSYSQEIQLKGTITNETGVPVSGSYITLKNHLSISTRSITDGSFTLRGTKKSDVQSDSLVVVSKGYKTVLEKITDFAKTDMTIKQKPSNPWISSGPLEHRKGMVNIKANGHDFEMGQPSDTVRGLEQGYPSTDVEQPVHTVNFTYDFWMDTVEVRQSEYDSLMKLIYGSKYVRPTWSASNGLGGNYAAYSVDWGNGAAFCNARSKAEGLRDTAYSYSEMITDPFGVITLNNVSVNLHAQAYRLPTEAEWEYAARGGTSTDYYWGKDYKPYPVTSSDSVEAGQYAIFSYNSGSLPKDQRIGDSYYGINEVGRKKPNRYGLYDMLGNVSEWCNDWYDFYGWGQVTDPAGPTPSDISQYERVIRGGNWGNIHSYIRVTERTFQSSDYQFLFKGFRCVSSGLSTGVIKTTRTTPSRKPHVITVPGSIKFTNVSESEIGIYSFDGKLISTVRPNATSYSIKTCEFTSGSYIIKIISAKTISHATVTIMN